MSREAVADSLRLGVLSSGELRPLQALHEGVGRSFAAAISGMLRNPLEARLAGADQLSYGKFVHGLEDPSYFSVLTAEPLGDRVLLDVELAILYPILDRMLGGRGDEPPPRRALSDIELPLAARIVRVFLANLRDVWQNILPLQFESLQVGSHPRLLRVLPADETVVVLGFTLSIGNRQGMMRLCLPCRALRQVADKLSGGGRMEPSAAREPEADSRERGADVAVTLATTSISASELRGLCVGDVIVTETPADAPAVVSIDGAATFCGRPGVSQGKKAIAITQQRVDEDRVTGENNATA